MLQIFAFLASKAGRWTRAITGLVLIGLGMLVVGSTAGAVLAIIGLVPLAAGLLDSCIFARLAGLPLSGPALRIEIERRLAPHAVHS